MASNANQRGDNSFQHILKTEKPDKEIEYFWLTFKKSIHPYVDKHEQNNIKKISDTLNKLQKEEQYNQIEYFISKYLHDICFSILMTKDFTEIDHLKTNIKRWERISKYKIFNKNDLVGIMLGIASSIKTRNNKNKNKILDLIALWCKENKYKNKYVGFEYINQIVKICMDNLYYGTLDKLSNGVYLYKCVDMKLTEDEINKIKNYRGKAFHKFYKNFNNKQTKQE